LARHEGAKPRAAAKRRVSKPRHDRAPRQGTPDWQLALIDERHVQTLVAARKVGLPLAMAAEMAGISPELAQLWLSYGRQMQSLGQKEPTTKYGRDCRAFAREWDTAVVGLIAVMRGYMVQHAKKDPRACAQALSSFEREYQQRRHRRASLPDYAQHVSQVGEDLAEPFAPLELSAGAPQRPPPQARFSHVNPDGSRTDVAFGQGLGPDSFTDEMDGRTDEELEYYAQHGSWPHEAPVRPIDTTAEEVPDDLVEGGVEEEIARLQGALKGEGGPAGEDAGPRPIQPPAGPERPLVGPVQQPVAVVMPVAPARPLRRRNPEDGLVELTDPVAVIPPGPKAPKVPTFAPLPRLDPDAVR
jgi:hypothetical protein